MGIPERHRGRPPLTPEMLRRLWTLPQDVDLAGIRLLYVFGPAVRSPTPQDIDVAVLADDFDVAFQRIADRLGTDRLDVVDLARADEAMLLTVLRTGRCIHRSAVRVENDFEMKALRRIQDSEIWRRNQDAWSGASKWPAR